MKPIAVQRLNHAVLFVSDLERAASFYERVFGFTRIAEQGPMAFLRAAVADKYAVLAVKRVS